MREINISKDREIVNCDLCGSNNFKLWDKKEPRIVKCNSCDLVYQNDRPTINILENFYGISYVENRKVEENGKRYRDRAKMYDIEINDIIKEFFDHRLEMYQVRKAYQLKILKFERDIIKYKVRFIVKIIKL